MVVISIRRPHIPWDSWAYHLPFSAQLLNIQNYSQSFILTKVLQDRYDGFPLLAELIQGVIWQLTNNISSAVLLNSGALFLFVVIASVLTKKNFSVLVFGLLAVPLVAVHAFSTYVDLFLGVAIALQFISAIKLQNDLIKSSTKIDLWLALYVTSAVFAGNTKMWGAIISTFLSIYFIIDSLVIGKIKFQRLRLIALVFVIASFLSSGTLIKNYVKFDNPFYPIEVSSSILKINFIGPEPELKHYPGYAEEYGPFARPIYFFNSISELDWTIRGVDPEYKFEDGIGDNPKRYLPARTGGWWRIVFGFSLFVLAGLYLKSKFDNTTNTESLSFSMRCFICLMIFTSFMPQSHELRFFLYIPIILIFLVAYLSSITKAGVYFLPYIATIYFGLFLFSVFVLRDESFKSLAAYISLSEHIGVSSESKEVAYAREHKELCLGPKYNASQFKYSSIFQGGDYVIEQGFFGCKKFTNYDLVKK
jgi:hypothetical protein